MSAHQVSKNPGLPLDFGQKFVDVCSCKHTQGTFVALTSICEISCRLIIISAWLVNKQISYSRMVLTSKWAKCNCLAQLFYLILKFSLNKAFILTVQYQSVMLLDIASWYYLVF